MVRGIRFVAIDTPGFEFSDPAPSSPTVEQWAPSIATELALQYPRRVRRLVLNGPFPLTAAERAARLERSKVTSVRDRPRLDGSHLLETFQTRPRMYGPNPDLDAVTRGVALKYQALGPHWWGHHAAYLYDHARSLGRLTQPTLIFTNTSDDIYDFAQRAHDIVDQQPEGWSDSVVGSLRRP